MKILYVVSAYGPRYVANEIHRELVQEFSRRGHTCLVYAGVTPGELQGDPVSYQDGPVAVYRRLCDTRGRHRIASELSRCLFQYPRFLSLLQGLRNLLALHPDIDVIHADAVYPIGTIVVWAARGHRAAIIPSIHGGDLIDYPGYGYGRYRSTRHLIRWTFAQSAMVRANSPLMAERAQTLGCAPEKLRHVLVNIGDRFFADDTNYAARRLVARQTIRSRLGLGPGAPLLLSVGRLLPLKGTHDIVAAVGIVAKQVPSIRLVIAGPNIIDERLGDQRAALRRMIAEHGVEAQVILRDGLEYNNELPAYLAGADMLVAPAHIEGLNRVVAEAGSQGTPSIVSSTTGVAPLVLRLDAGRIVEPHAPEAIAAAASRLFSRPAELAHLGANARRLSQYFRSAVIADALLDLYAVPRAAGD